MPGQCTRLQPGPRERSWPAGTEWTIDPEPSLEIGTAAGDSVYRPFAITQALRMHDGRYLGRVTVPAGLEVDQIGADFVLGRYSDEIGVEYVRVYALHRSR